MSERHRHDFTSTNCMVCGRPRSVCMAETQRERHAHDLERAAVSAEPTKED